MDDDRIDPETEKALRDAMDEAEKDVRLDGITSMAAYMRQSYEAFRKTGFNRKQSFSFTVLLYQNLLSR